MGANMTGSAINRLARSVTTLCHIRDKFDSESNVPVPTSTYSTKSDQEDVDKVVSVLLKNKILTITPGRRLSHFKNPLNDLKWANMNTWILRKQKQTASLKCALGEGNLSDSDATDCSESDSDSES